MNTFKNLGLEPSIINALETQHIVKPTPVQALTIPSILNRQDVMAEAQTGTGKTLAFLLPIFQQLSQSNASVKNIIITPTRELALQITAEAKKLNTDNHATILAVYGGQDINAQLHKLKGNVDIIIATPGRLLDHLRRGTIDLSSLQTLVLDEADQMLHIGFKNEIEQILKQTNKDKQMLCFSATLDSKVKKLAYRYMNAPVELAVEKETITLSTIRQQIIKSSDRWKQEALFDQLNKTNPFLGIIFCRTKRRADKLEAEMTQAKYLCNKLHGSMTQNARQRVMKSFRNAKFQYLIATDVAARGLDITGVSHIYNYDIPESPEAYIHRIGRTGRMGDEGCAITFVAPRDEILLKAIESQIKLEIPSESYMPTHKREGTAGPHKKNTDKIKNVIRNRQRK